MAKIRRVLSQVKSFVEMFLLDGEFVRNQEVFTKPRESVCEPIIAQSCEDMAAILLDDNMGAERDIILHQRYRGIERINDKHRAFHPLRFALLFPHGGLDRHLGFRPKEIPQAIRTEFHSWICSVQTLHQGQWVLIAALHCKIISA